MTIGDQLEAAAATAEQSLTDTCVIVRHVEDEWTPDGGMPNDEVELWRGPCSLSAPGASGRRSDYGSDDRAIFATVLRVPLPHRCGPDGLQGGDLVYVGGRTLTILAEQRRSNRVLQRLRVVDVEHAGGVPL